MVRRDRGLQIAVRAVFHVDSNHAREFGRRRHDRVRTFVHLHHCRTGNETVCPARVGHEATCVCFLAWRRTQGLAVITVLKWSSKMDDSLHFFCFYLVCDRIHLQISVKENHPLALVVCANLCKFVQAFAKNKKKQSFFVFVSIPFFIALQLSLRAWQTNQVAQFGPGFVPVVEPGPPSRTPLPGAALDPPAPP